MGQVVLYENINEGGRTFVIADGDNIPVIPPPLGGQASSFTSDIHQWITFWESANYNQGDDQLWLEPPDPGFFWKLDNLHTLWRPHGNNHWGDRIHAVSFSGPPQGDNDNRTILYKDGHLGGNLGLLAFSNAGLLHQLRDSVTLVSGEMPRPKALFTDVADLPAIRIQFAAAQRR